MDEISKPAAAQAWVAAAPGVFVLLWSTGFISAKLGAPYAEPFTFLFWRFVIAVVLFAAICLLFRAPWPKTRAEYGQAIIAGWLVHGVHLGGVFWAIEGGVPAGMTAIIVGIHPPADGGPGRALLRRARAPAPVVRLGARAGWHRSDRVG